MVSSLHHPCSSKYMNYSVSRTHLAQAIISVEDVNRCFVEDVLDYGRCQDVSTFCFKCIVKVRWLRGEGVTQGTQRIL